VEPKGLNRLLWVAGVVTTLASMTVLFLGLEPSAFNYLATFLLLGSIGLLAFVSASQALIIGARYEETVHQVEDVEEGYRSLHELVNMAMDARTRRQDDPLVRLCLELGRWLDLPGDRMHHLEWAALLHDIGRVRLDEDALKGTGAISATRWAEMEEHPFFSYSILSQVDALAEAAHILYCHHEHFDGSGYPRGLTGEHLPLESCIYAVACTYEALTSGRDGRPGLSHRQAVDHIIGQTGRKFDPAVVDAFAEWAEAADTGDDAFDPERIIEAERPRITGGLPRLDKARWA
jgi:HD-GYP domain-containing protein (c-di-GMP phosphodiesterase class II)